jgi:hypothetical protein
MAACLDLLPGLGLVGVDLGDPPVPQGALDARVKVFWEGGEAAFGCGEQACLHDVGGEGRVSQDFFQFFLACAGFHGRLIVFCFAVQCQQVKKQKTQDERMEM